MSETVENKDGRRTVATSTSSGAPASTGAGGARRNWVTLFGGKLTSEWKMSTIRNQPRQNNPGTFKVDGDELVAHPGTDLGLLWHTRPTPPNYVLEVEWMLTSLDDNSGVFVRFPDITTKGYDNEAWVAINFGFEVQINEPGVPDGASEHRTGAIYAEKDQSFTRVVANPPGEWNKFEIRVEGQTYEVHLNGQRVTHFENKEAAARTRGQPSTPSAPTFIGVQTHTGQVRYRKIRIRAL